jgi:hypothetical protein
MCMIYEKLFSGPLAHLDPHIASASTHHRFRSQKLTGPLRIFSCFLSGQCCSCSCITYQLKANYGSLKEHMTNRLESDGLTVHNPLLLKNHFINIVVGFRFHFTRSKNNEKGGQRQNYFLEISLIDHSLNNFEKVGISNLGP